LECNARRIGGGSKIVNDQVNNDGMFNDHWNWVSKITPLTKTACSAIIGAGSAKSPHEHKGQKSYYPRIVPAAQESSFHLWRRKVVVVRQAIIAN
jgi:hypothetical protein